MGIFKKLDLIILCDIYFSETNLNGKENSYVSSVGKRKKKLQSSVINVTRHNFNLGYKLNLYMRVE